MFFRTPPDTLQLFFPQHGRPLFLFSFQSHATPTKPNLKFSPVPLFPLSAVSMPVHPVCLLPSRSLLAWAVAPFLEIPCFMREVSFGYTYAHVWKCRVGRTSSFLFRLASSSQLHIADLYVFVVTHRAFPSPRLLPPSPLFASRS